MPYNDELKFESDLVSLLTSSFCNWEKSVIKNPTEEDLIQNWADILYQNNKEKDILNGCPLTAGEMNQIITQINTLRTPVALNTFINGKTVSIHRDNLDDTLHFGEDVSLKIYDRDEIAGGKSRYQVVEQPQFKTNNKVYPSRRGDVMLLINGMPIFHIELKRTGVDISQAEVQIEKYMENGCFTGLFSLVQIFVAMNPEDVVYFANPGSDGKFNPDFYFHWENFNNEIVYDWKEFTETVLSIPMAHEMVGYYTIPDDSDGVLKVLRSYQYFAAYGISERVEKTNWTKAEQHGGYVWHTTGSGKTMTSFKAAQLISNAKCADKVVFLVDRTELGEQSLNNYRNFANPDESVQATEDTNTLLSKLKSSNPDDVLIVTSIQKMSRIKDENGVKAADLKKIQDKHIVFVIDECHRDQKGDMHQGIKKTFPNAIYFGFTGTPDYKYTTDIFGDEIHRYTIYHGIRDNNVLGFDPYKILVFPDDDIRKQIALKKCNCKNEQEVFSRGGDTLKLYNEIMDSHSKTWTMQEIEKEVPTSQFEQDEYRKEVVKDIIGNWTVRSYNSLFHAILATSSIPEAIEYYKLFKMENHNLHITCVFDPSDNNDGTSISKMNGVTEILTDYKNMFGNEYQIGTYSKFKRDVCARLSHKKPYQNLKPEERIDIVIVVDQLLTGFDSKWLNTMYLDKVLYGMNLIQAMSRTNRLFGPQKPHGTIYCYRYPHTMEKNIYEAVEKYSGNKPFGIFVDKLEKNLNAMNLVFDEIKELFESEGIENFEKNASDLGWEKEFAKKFVGLNRYLESAKIQGFTWEILEYIFEKENGTQSRVQVQFDKNSYLILLKRYQELFVYIPGVPEPPFPVDPNLKKENIDRIDANYIETKFKMYLKQINLGDKEAIEKALKDLHGTFASLSQNEQKLAKQIIYDLQSGTIHIDKSKTFRDCLNEYLDRQFNDMIYNISNALGIDEAQLREMMNLHLDESNINSFGRFDALKSTIDINKAMKFFSKSETNITKKKAKILSDELLERFILSGGFDIAEV